MIYKVDITHAGHSDPDRFAFVGKVSPSLVPILNKLTTPKDIGYLSRDDTVTLTATLGRNWEEDCGVYAFNRFSGLQHSDQDLTEEACATHLKKQQITSAKEALAQVLTMSSQDLNCYRRVYKSAILQKYENLKAQSLTFVPMLIDSDDSITMIKNKIFISVCLPGNIGFKINLSPQWQYLWCVLEVDGKYQGNTCIGHSLKSIETDQIVGFPSNPFTLNNKCRFPVNTSVSTQDEYILDDYGDIKFSTIFVAALHEVVQSLRPEIDRTLLSKWLSIYYPFLPSDDLSKTIASDRVQVTQSLSVMQQKLAENARICDVIRDQQVSTDIHVDDRVKFCRLSVDSSSSDRDADLLSLFTSVRPGNQVKLVCYRGEKRLTKAGQVVKYKLSRQGLNFTKVQTWMNPRDESRKPSTLTMHLVLNSGDTDVTLIINNSGSYHILMSALEGQTIGFGTIREILLDIRHFITHSLWSQLSLPDSDVLARRISNTAIDRIDCELSIKSKSLKPMNYLEAYKLGEHFSPFIFFINGSADIRRYLTKYQHRRRIVLQLLKLGLLDMSALQSLSTSEWKQLRLLTDDRLNSMILLDLRQYVERSNARKITFGYKRHSLFESLQQYSRFIRAFLIEHKLSLQDISDQNSEVYHELIRLTCNRLNLSKAEAQAILDKYTTETEGLALSDRTGIQVTWENGDNCQVVKIEGVRQYTENGSLSFLLNRVKTFFLKFLALYNENNVHEFMTAHQQDKVSKDIAADAREKATQDLLQQYILDEDPSDSVGADVSMSDTTSAPLQESTKPDSELASAHTKGEYKMQRLQQHDPEIYSSWKDRKSNAAASCPKQRQPIVLKEEEYKVLDKSTFKNPKGTPDGFKYRNNYYICPEVWCRSLRRSMHAADLNDKVSVVEIADNGKKLQKIVSGKCPDGEEALLATSGVSGWRAKGVTAHSSNEGRMEYPGFLRHDTHPAGLGVPCCFQKDQSHGTSAKTAYFHEQMHQRSPEVRVVEAESTRRNPLGPSRFPIGPGRFGLLPEQLEVFFNGNNYKRCTGKIYGTTHCFFRTGVDVHLGSTFLSCIAKALCQVVGSNRFASALDLKKHICLHLSDGLLWRSLKNGNLHTIFTPRGTGTEAVDNFKSYLLASNVTEDYVWDLVSRPVDWLFPAGLNIFVFQYDKATHQVFLVCPKGEIMSQFYDSKRPGVFLITDGVSYELVCLIDSSLDIDCIFASYTSHKRVAGALAKCSTASRSDYTPRNLINSLKRTADRACQPRWQYVTKYNKVKYIILECGVALPTQPHGPWCDPQTPTPLTWKYTPPSFQTFCKIQKSLARVFEQALTPTKVVLNSHHHPAAVRTSNSLIVPVMAHKSPLPVDHSTIFHDADDALYAETTSPDARIQTLQAEEQLLQGLAAFRNKLRFVLIEDLHSTTKDKYWFRLDNILSGVDKAGKSLSLSAKKSLLIDVFLKGSNALVRQIVIPDDSVHQDRLLKQLQQSTSHDRKITLPKRLIQRFVSQIVDEILRFPSKRRNIMNDTFIPNPPKSKLNSVRLTKDFVEFDDSVADYVLNILQRFDPIAQASANVVDCLPVDLSADSPTTEVKKHILYNSLYAQSDGAAVK